MKLETENKLLSNFCISSLGNIVLLLLTFFLLSFTQPAVKVQEPKVETEEMQTPGAPAPTPGPAGTHLVMSGPEGDSAATAVQKVRSMEGPVGKKSPVAVTQKKVPPRVVQNPKSVKERAVKRGSATKGKRAGGGRKGK